MNKNAELLAETTGQEAIQPEQLLKVKPLEGTPFTIVQREHEYILTMGNKALTEPKNSEAELKEWMELQKWNLVTIIAYIVAEDIVNENMKLSRTPLEEQQSASTLSLSRHVENMEQSHNNRTTETPIS